MCLTPLLFYIVEEKKLSCIQARTVPRVIRTLAALLFTKKKKKKICYLQFILLVGTICCYKMLHVFFYFLFQFIITFMKCLIDLYLSENSFDL